MSKTTITDPDGAGQKQVAQDGRLYLGERYAGERVEFAVKIVESDDE
jgi:hypothetical protein